MSYLAVRLSACVNRCFICESRWQLDGGCEPEILTGALDREGVPWNGWPCETTVLMSIEKFRASHFAKVFCGDTFAPDCGGVVGSLVPCPANNLHIKPRLHIHGCVANPRDSVAIAAVCALPWARIHRFHFMQLFAGQDTSALATRVGVGCGDSPYRPRTAPQMGRHLSASASLVFSASEGRRKAWNFFSESWGDQVQGTVLSADMSTVQRSPPRRHRLVGLLMAYEKDAPAGLMSQQPTVRETDAPGGVPMLSADSDGAQMPGRPGRHRETLGRIPVLKREPTSQGMGINHGAWLEHAADLADQLVCAGLEDSQSALY
jgi:hypothetical protein